jgi:hypothetical protein
MFRIRGSRSSPVRTYFAPGLTRLPAADMRELAPHLARVRHLRSASGNPRPCGQAELAASWAAR